MESIRRALVLGLVLIAGIAVEQPLSVDPHIVLFIRGINLILKCRQVLEFRAVDIFSYVFIKI